MRRSELEKVCKYHSDIRLGNLRLKLLKKAGGEPVVLAENRFSSKKEMILSSKLVT